jgi:hypothetical protein
LRATCPRDIPADSVAQVDVSSSAVDAMLAAVNAVLPSIEGFYATLGDEQKARIVAVSARATNVNEDARRARRSVCHARRTEGTPDQSGMCERWGSALLDWPRRRIDRDIRLTIRPVARTNSCSTLRPRAGRGRRAILRNGVLAVIVG